MAFDPAEGVGGHLATLDRDEQGQPWRFIDMGAQIATCPFGENDPELTKAILAALPAVLNRYAHSVSPGRRIANSPWKGPSFKATHSASARR